MHKTNEYVTPGSYSMLTARADGTGNREISGPNLRVNSKV